MSNALPSLFRARLLTVALLVTAAAIACAPKKDPGAVTPIPVTSAVIPPVTPPRITKPLTPVMPTPLPINDNPGRVMTGRATGTFEVVTKPITPYNTSAPTVIGRMSIDKQFHGNLEGASKGEMLTGGAFASGSAGYVAMERIVGTLNGRKGSFILQHTGTMDHGVPGLTVTVVPGSGTEELAGLTGSMSIIIEKGKHSYEFSYTLPAR